MVFRAASVQVSRFREFRDSHLARQSVFFDHSRSQKEDTVAKILTWLVDDGGGGGGGGRY